MNSSYNDTTNTNKSRESILQPCSYKIHPLEGDQKTDLKIFEQHLAYSYNEERKTAQIYKIVALSIIVLFFIYTIYKTYIIKEVSLDMNGNGKMLFFIGCFLVCGFLLCGFHKTRGKAHKNMISRCNNILRLFKIKFNEEKQRLVRIKIVPKLPMPAQDGKSESEAFHNNLKRVEHMDFSKYK
ncbi:developmentally-regulated internal PM-anchored protein [Acrasis kona]|uniref:Transmembrane protein 188 n=1 Tax=Acrasis kona TaxID=1008807 RepID=A0AAW2ZP39_9EUKA